MLDKIKSPKFSFFLLFYLSLLIFAFSVTPVTATTISGVTVTTNSERFANGQDRRALHIVDGSGLNISNGTHTTTPDEFMWLNENGYPGFPPGTPVSDVWLKFDLGDLYNVSTMNVWNYNEGVGLNVRGTRGVSILVNSVDDPNLNNWTDMFGATEFNQAQT